jgi:hypothetical protein
MYLGISPSKFDELVRDGRLGPAKILDGRKLYAVEMLDEFFDALPDETHDADEDWRFGYDRDSFVDDAPQTSAWLRRGP